MSEENGEKMWFEEEIGIQPEVMQLEEEDESGDDDAQRGSRRSMRKHPAVNYEGMDTSRESVPRGARQYRHLVRKENEPLDTEYSQRKVMLTGLSWDRFMKLYSFSFPEISTDTKYVKKIVDVENERSLAKKYEEMVKAWFQLYSKPPGAPRSDSRDSSTITFQTMQDLDWALFVGIHPSQYREIFGQLGARHMTYEHYDLIIEWFQKQTSEIIQQIKEYRDIAKQKFLDDGQDSDDPYPYKFYQSGTVHWMVHQEVPLPWMIFTDYHWHNSKAVDPDNATDYEIILCGKLVHTNENMYRNFTELKRLLPLAREIENMTFPTYQDSEIFVHWNEGECFAWYNPCYKLMCLPTYHVGYGLFLAFDKQLVDESIEKVFVPQQSNIVISAGEIRPLDIRVADSYAFNQVDARNLHLGDEKQGSYLTNIVFTDYMGYANRPGVGNVAFMANSTCDNPEHELFFKASWTQIGYKQKLLIKNSDYAAKHHVIRAHQDITGHEIRNWNSQANPIFHELFPFESFEDQYIFPVEFEYADSRQKKQSFQEKQTILAQSAHPVHCRCYTHCIFKDKSQRTLVDLYRTETTVDDSRIGTPGRYKHLFKGPFKEYAKEYILQYPDIAKSLEDLMISEPKE